MPKKRPRPTVEMSLMTMETRASLMRNIMEAAVANTPKNRRYGALRRLAEASRDIEATARAVRYSLSPDALDTVIRSRR